jgi:hypothetical protein
LGERLAATGERHGEARQGGKQKRLSGGSPSHIRDDAYEVS